MAARTDALSINIDANTADKLAEIQGFVIETIQKGAVLEKMKNTEYSGEPTTGSVEIDRLQERSLYMTSLKRRESPQRDNYRHQYLGQSWA